MNAIEVTNLEKSSEHKNNVVKAVNSLTLTIPQGEAFGLLGPNGAGKATTMRMLSTLMPVDGVMHML